VAEDRATFVIEGETALLGVMDLVQAAKRLSVEQLRVVPGAEEDDHRRALIAFAETAAHALDLSEVQLRAGVVADTLAAAQGYRDGIKSVRKSRAAQAAAYLEGVGVPLWRDGTATLGTTLYYRGVWAAIAMLVGLGSVSIAVFSNSKLSWLHIALPALLCFIATLFAVWQICLVVFAARRTGHRLAFAATAGASAAAIVLIGAALYDRAVPSLAELWAIYAGDEALGDLVVKLSPDGKTLYIDGAYGTGSETTVREMLDRHPGIRDVVLSGPGGRVGVGFAINNMIRKRRLATRVESGCASACTIAFLGGVDRSISPGGRLGFHQTSFPGMAESDMYESNRDMRRFLVRGAGITPEFAQRVVDTPPGSIWVPTPAELLAGRVIHRVKQ
jgi:hypothetical protein